MVSLNWILNWSWGVKDQDSRPQKALKTDCSVQGILNVELSQEKSNVKNWGTVSCTSSSWTYCPVDHNSLNHVIGLIDINVRSKITSVSLRARRNRRRDLSIFVSALHCLSQSRGSCDHLPNGSVSLDHNRMKEQLVIDRCCNHSFIEAW